MNKKKFTTGRMKKLPKVQRKKKRVCTTTTLHRAIFKREIGEGRKAVTSLVRMDRLFGEFLWYIVLNGSDDFLMLMQDMSMMVMMTIAMKQTIK